MRKLRLIVALVVGLTTTTVGVANAQSTNTAVSTAGGWQEGRDACVKNHQRVLKAKYWALTRKGITEYVGTVSLCYTTHKDGVMVRGATAGGHTNTKGLLTLTVSSSGFALNDPKGVRNLGYVPRGQWTMLDTPLLVPRGASITIWGGLDAKRALQTNFHKGGIRLKRQ